MIDTQSSPSDPDTLFMQALGFLQNRLHDPAEKLLRQVIDLNRAQDRTAAEAYARMALARLFADRGEFAEAGAELDAAAKALQVVEDRVGQVRVAFESGEVAERQGNAVAARHAYEQALALADMPSEVGAAHMRLGVLAREAAHPEGAASHYRAAMEAFGEAGNELAAARAKYELARLRKVVPEAESRVLLSQAAELARALGDETLLELISSEIA
jgi:tetratricopeptide (TPR) repeat protein